MFNRTNSSASWKEKLVGPKDVTNGGMGDDMGATRHPEKGSIRVIPGF